MDRTAALTLLGLAGLGMYAWSNTDSGNGASNPQGNSSSPSTCPPHGGLLSASDLMAKIKANDPCAFTSTWVVTIRTHDELRYFGELLSGHMLLRAESERPGNTLDKAALAKMEAWFLGCRFYCVDPAWAALKDKEEGHRLALRYYSEPHFKQTLGASKQKELLAQSQAALAQIQERLQAYPAGSLPLYEHFRQVLHDYSGREPIYLSVPGNTNPQAWIYDRASKVDETYPSLYFPNMRWALGLPHDRYEQIIFAFHKGQWCPTIKEEIWRDADSNGWPGGWIRRPEGHPYFENCASKDGTNHAEGWSGPSESLRDILMPRVFAKASETFVYEYAAAHFLQTIYLATLNLNAAKENAQAALQTASKALVLAGAAATASTGGIGAIAGAIVAGVGLLLEIVNWAVQLPQNIEREKLARLRAANLLHQELARLNRSVDQFFGWRFRLNRPTHGMGLFGQKWTDGYQYGRPTVYRRTEQGTFASTENDTQPFSLMQDPWMYFRIPMNFAGTAPETESGMPQLPLLVLKPDFDFSVFTAYKVDGAAINAIRVEPELRPRESWTYTHSQTGKTEQVPFDRPQQTFRLLRMGLDLKGLRTPGRAAT